MPPLSATLQTEFATDGFDLGDAVGLLGHAMDLVGPALGVDIDAQVVADIGAGISGGSSAGTEVGVKTPSGTRRWIRV
jgi:hypothetical protein